MAVAVRADPPGARAILAWFDRHNLFWAAVCAIAALALVARRRALIQISASRSWTAALPIERSTGRWQAIAVGSVPAFGLCLALALLFGTLSVAALVDASLAPPLMTWAATTGGVGIGAALGFLLPSLKPEEIYEGSRYVPHRRRVSPSVPTGSLAALGSWPVRQMFANARPKTLARAMLPLFLAAPLGSSAADAMLAIGLLAAIGAVVLLVAAVLSVGAKASRWLRPLPLDRALVTRKTSVPALLLMVGMAIIESGLLWMLGSPLTRCIAIGAATLVVATVCVVAGKFSDRY